MKVELVLLRNIIIEDSFNIVNVYSASDDIGRNKNIKFAAPVVIHDAVARTLGRPNDFHRSPSEWSGWTIIQVWAWDKRTPLEILRDEWPARAQYVEDVERLPRHNNNITKEA